MNDVNKAVIKAFREGHELPEGMHRDRLLLLTTIGRKSGEQRVTPLMYHRDKDGELYVIAANNGSVDDPIWYRNVLQDASVSWEIINEDGELASLDGLASTIADAKRDQIWSEIVQANGFFEGMQKKISRIIPIVELNPVA